MSLSREITHKWLVRIKYKSFPEDTFRYSKVVGKYKTKEHAEQAIKQHWSKCPLVYGRCETSEPYITEHPLAHPDLFTKE